jgi:prepilin-type N-terminal cleavage/methylation domain-containing protein
LDFRKLNLSPGFTLLELLVVLILMGLISTVIVTNTSFVDRYQSDQVEPYKEFLSEESALTKKTLAWFIGENTQSIYALKKNEWHSQNFDSSYYPNISNKIIFKDARGQVLLFSNETELPFLIFYPSGQSSGGEIHFNEDNSGRVLAIDAFGKVIDNRNNYVASKGL